MHYLFNSVRHYAFLFFCLFISFPAEAGFVTFEGLPENLLLSNEIQGLTFSGAEVLTAFSSLNEIDFPPHSGENVVASVGGSLTVSFDAPMNMVSGYFSYADAAGLTLSLYDLNNFLLASALFPMPIGSNNLVSNEFIALGAPGIHSLVITLNSAIPDNVFTLDDLSYIPEPATYLLLAIGVMGIGISMFARIRSKPL